MSIVSLYPFEARSEGPLTLDPVSVHAQSGHKSKSQVRVWYLLSQELCLTPQVISRVLPDSGHWFKYWLWEQRGLPGGEVGTDNQRWH